MNEYDRHIVHIDLDEDSIYLKGGCQLPSTETIADQKLQSEELYLAINSLSEIQKRRIKMYYFENKSLKEIAKIVKKIFSMTLEGNGRIKICKYLNDSGILCKKELQRRNKRELSLEPFEIVSKYL